MGIRGLTSLINENPGLLKDYELKSTQVVIDGTSLGYRIFMSFKVECSFCGEYLAFRNAISSFLSRLRSANVNPLFVFDGPIDKYESKLQTVLKRHKEAINRAMEAMQHKGNIVLPLLAFDVFLKLLHQQAFNVLVCLGDADRTIAACANYLNCPVISMDSDFLVFPLNNGYIPFNSIDLSDPVPVSAVRCKIYKTDNWLDLLPRLDKTLLPIFAVVIGNDFFQSDAFGKFFDQIAKPHVPTRELALGTLKQCNMVGFLEWLQGKRYDDALEELLTCVSNENQQLLRRQIEEAVSFYSVNALSIEECRTYISSELSASGFPAWFVDAYCTGNLYRLANMVYVRRGQTVLLPIVLENVFLSSVYECSKPLRAVIYGIMLQETGHRLVTEYVRVVNTYRPTTIPIREDMPSMNDIEKLSDEDRRKLITNSVSIYPNSFDTIPEQLHLFVLSLKFWMDSASIELSEYVALALAATAIILNARISSTSELLLRLYKKPVIESHQEKKRYLTFVHAVNQWQSCLGTLQCLNELLMQPLLEADFSRLFSGKLAFNLYQSVLRSRQPVNTVVKMLPNGAKVLGMPHDQLLAKLQSIIPFPKDVERENETSGKAKDKTRHRVKVKLVPSVDTKSDTSSSDWDDDNSFAALKLAP
uniref:Asteroid domain-containing protein n=1 Tax=Trichuris muris TaxID=70415 RepID=A0A5S6QZB2_TRIMR